jgi:RNA polymerase sigma-70 factor (sigma-E family)
MFGGGGSPAGGRSSGGGGSGGTREAEHEAPGVDSAEAREGPDQARLISSNHGAEDRFREFVAERWVALLRTAYLLTGDYGHAEDLVQTALIRVHRHWGKVERAESPEAYVRKIMVTAHTDWWRRFGSRERAERLTPEFDDLSTVDAYASVELRDELWAALQSLPAKMRAALVLRYFEDLGEAETARILDCSVGTVKSQTSRGLQRLQKALSKPPPSESSPGRRPATPHSQAEVRTPRSPSPTSSSPISAVPRPPMPGSSLPASAVARPSAAGVPLPPTPLSSAGVVSPGQPSAGIAPAAVRPDPR